MPLLRISMVNRWILRPTAAATLLLLLAVAAGCAEPRAPVVDLVDIAPVADGVVATDVLHLGEVEEDELPREGWSRRPFTGQETGRLVIGRQASLPFESVGSGDTTLVVEIRPFRPPGTAPQRVAIAVNGDRIAARELRDGWNEVGVQLPGSAVVAGRNELQILFADALRPADHLPDSDDTRPVAALVRRVRFRPASGRPVRPGQRPGIEWSTEGPPTLSMPADSLIDVYYELPRRARLEGVAGFEPVAGARRGGARLVLRLADREGDEVHLLDRRLEADGGPAPIDVDLAEWAGEVVRLRLVVVAETNGRVLVRDPRITVPASVAGDLPEPLPTVAEPPGAGRLGRPDVYVILLDAARADAFSCYGSPHPTPAVDALAEAGTRFARGYSTSSWTGQSVPSLLTGRYPDAIGAEVWGSRLPEGVPTLAEILRDGGYHTVLWSQHSVYRGNVTFRRGFDLVTTASKGERDLLPTDEELRPPDDGGQPVFALIHLLPPHGGYHPPEPFRGRLTSWYEGDVRVTAKALNQFPRRRDPSELTPEDVRYVRGRYQENVLYADHLVGRLLDRLREAGRFDDALIFLVSDHGEGFLEHGQFMHTSTVYEEMIGIPFLVKWPAGDDGFRSSVESPVSLVDVAPTIVDGLELGSPAAGFQGRSLLEAASGDEELRRPVYALSRRGTSRDHPARWVHALLLGGWKLVFDRDDGGIELYELRTDPGEAADLVDRDPLRARFLLQRLLRVRRYNLGLDPREDEGQTELELDPETLEELRALGYLQ